MYQIIQGLVSNTGSVKANKISLFRDKDESFSAYMRMDTPKEKGLVVILIEIATKHFLSKGDKFTSYKSKDVSI